MLDSSEGSCITNVGIDCTLLGGSLGESYTPERRESHLGTVRPLNTDENMGRLNPALNFRLVRLSFLVVGSSRSSVLSDVSISESMRRLS